MLALAPITVLSAFVGMGLALLLGLDAETPAGVAWMAAWVFGPFIVSAVLTEFEGREACA